MPAAAVAASHSTVTFAGQVTSGAVVSTMVIVCRQSLPTLPQPSVAVQVRVMADSLAQEPAATLSLAATIGAGSQLSVAAAVPVPAAAVAASHSTVTFAGQVMSGAVVSIMVMVWVQLLLLPQSSVAVQVRVMLDAPAQLPAAMLSDKAMTGVLVQLSVAVAEPVSAAAVEASHSRVTLAGQEMSGAMLSVTVIVWTQLPTLPHSSVLDQLREITVSTGQLPEATLSLGNTAVAPSQLSVAVALPDGLTEAPQLTVKLAGQVTSGAVVSTMVIVCRQSLPMLPQASVAVQVRVMTDSLEQEPAATPSLAEIIGAGSQLSVAVAVPVPAAAAEASHSTVTFAGQVMTGAVRSSTVMVWVQLLLLLQSSVAVQVRVMADSLAQEPAATLSLAATIGAGSQLSVAAAIPVPAAAVAASHSTVTFAGHVMTGAVGSTTVIA